MKLKKKVAEALNKQINSELHAFYTYLAMAAYFDSEDLPGFASCKNRPASVRSTQPSSYVSKPQDSHCTAAEQQRCPNWIPTVWQARKYSTGLAPFPL